jgi:alanine dehydrogenase
MLIGVPKEIKNHEYRVAITPAGVLELVRGGHQVYVEQGRLDEAAALAVDAMLELMGREHDLERREALALASVVVDLRVTQMVNGVRGVHARLAHHALR